MKKVVGGECWGRWQISAVTILHSQMNMNKWPDASFIFVERKLLSLLHVYLNSIIIMHCSCTSHLPAEAWAYCGCLNLLSNRQSHPQKHTTITLSAMPWFSAFYSTHFHFYAHTEAKIYIFSLLHVWVCVGVISILSIWKMHFCGFAFSSFTNRIGFGPSVAPYSIITLLSWYYY